MERPATWKVVTVGAAMTGLGLVGAGAAGAMTPEASLAAPTGAAAPLDVTFDISPGDFDLPYFFAMDDSWDNSWDGSWDDSWDD